MTVYLLKASELADETIGRMTAALPENRRGHAARLKRGPARAESVAGSYLVYYALLSAQLKGTADCGVVFPMPERLIAEHEKIAALAARIGWTAGGHGKPFPQGVDTGGANYHISLSHSGGLVAAAVADRPVGVDIQRIPDIPLSRMKKIAARFHPDEYERLDSLPDDRYAAAFCGMWACKESVLKLTGRGLSVSLSSFRVSEDGVCALDGKSIKLTVNSWYDAWIAAAVCAE